MSGNYKLKRGLGQSESLAVDGLPLTIDEGRNDVDTLDISQSAGRAVLPSKSPTQLRISKKGGWFWYYYGLLTICVFYGSFYAARIIWGIEKPAMSTKPTSLQPESESEKNYIEASKQRSQSSVQDGSSSWIIPIDPPDNANKNRISSKPKNSSSLPRVENLVVNSVEKQMPQRYSPIWEFALPNKNSRVNVCTCLKCGSTSFFATIFEMTHGRKWNYSGPPGFMSYHIRNDGPILKSQQLVAWRNMGNQLP